MAKLTEAQYAAIQILALPKRGGMTLEQVAEHVGVSDRSLRTWRNTEKFNNELKAQIARNTLGRLPEMMESMVDAVVDDKNAAMARTLLQVHGMLSDKVEVTTENKGADVDAIKAQIAAMKGGE